MNNEKQKFFKELKLFTDNLAKNIVQNNQWTMRGFIDRNFSAQAPDFRHGDKPLLL